MKSMKNGHLTIRLNVTVGVGRQKQAQSSKHKTTVNTSNVTKCNINENQSNPTAENFKLDFHNFRFKLLQHKI